MGFVAAFDKEIFYNPTGTVEGKISFHCSTSNCNPCLPLAQIPVSSIFTASFRGWSFFGRDCSGSARCRASASAG